MLGGATHAPGSEPHLPEPSQCLVVAVAPAQRVEELSLPPEFTCSRMSGGHGRRVLAGAS